MGMWSEVQRRVPTGGLPRRTGALKHGVGGERLRGCSLHLPNGSLPFGTASLIDD
jgi:hypothetical protein